MNLCLVAEVSGRVFPGSQWRWTLAEWTGGAATAKHLGLVRRKGMAYLTRAALLKADRILDELHKPACSGLSRKAKGRK